MEDAVRAARNADVVIALLACTRNSKARKRLQRSGFFAAILGLNLPGLKKSFSNPSLPR